MKPTVAIIGCGTVGTAIGRLLAAKEYPIEGVATRSLESAARASETIGARRFSVSPWEVSKGGHVVFITTPDDAIQSTCETISARGGFDKGTVVVHCSGALPSTILASARDSGAVVASLHPLQSFASVEQAERLVAGSYFAVEGDPAALGVVRGLVKDLGGVLMEITPEGKTLYHAAAVAASNYLITLMHLAFELSRSAGMAPEVSFRALLPLIQGSLNNIGTRGIPEALTGPIARGDVETVRAHLEKMKEQTPEFLLLYRVLGRYTVDLARAGGTLSDEAEQELIALFEN